MYLNKKYNWKALKKIVQQRLSQDKSGHDYNHIKRVLHNALEIAGSFKTINYDVLVAACLLHDISFKTGPKNHHITGAKTAKSILKSLKFPDKLIDQISDAIRNHNRGFAREKPTPKNQLSIEAKILCDADRLDGLGAIGIIRMTLFSSSQNIPYFKSKKDKIDETFYGNFKYLITLGEDLLTAAGKNIAKKRNKILKKFLRQFEKEYIKK